MSAPPLRLSRRASAEWAGLLVLLLLLAIVFVGLRWQAHAATGHDERERLQIQARGVTQHLALALQAAGNVLQGVEAEAALLHAAGDAPALSARLGELTRLVVAVESLHVLGADGAVVASSDTPRDGAALTRRGCFERARLRPDRHLLYACEPFRETEGVWSFDLLRPRFGARGEFTGAVSATLDADHLRTILPAALQSLNMRALLLSGSGIVIAASPPEAVEVGTDLRKLQGSLFEIYRANGQHNGVLQGASQTMGGRRIVAFQHVESKTTHLDQPLVLALSRSESAAFRPWWLATGLLAIGWLLAMLLASAALFMVQRRFRWADTRLAVLERERLEELERIELLVGSADVSLWDLDRANDRLTLDTHWWVAVGYPPGDTVRDANDWRRHIHPDDGESLRAEMQRQYSGEVAVAQCEYRLKLADGRWIWLSMHGRAITRDAAGEPLRVVGTLKDITERRAAEMAHRAIDEHLRESQKMESIGTLAGGIAHDFNNVLGAIIGNAELAQQEVGGSHPAQSSLRQITLAGQRARGLVQQILTFSRKQPEQLVEQPLRPLVEETLAMLRATLPARVTLVDDLTEAPLYVNADATQMHQVLMNLGTNAWHALRGSTGRIVVGLAAVDFEEGSEAPPKLAPGHYAHLWVSDDGCGMDEITRQRIFEPFFTTKPVGEGTGLGLAVVHGIVQTHLGAITLESEPRAGTCFHVYLPATERPSQVGALEEAERQAMLGRGQHVMYVDDDDVMVLLVARLLDRAGYRVTSCRSAREALAAFSDRPRAFDLIVTDFDMPGFSGLELAAELAHMRPDLPVVISSGYLSEELQSGARRLGIRHLLKKQNTFEELAGIVGRALLEAEVKAKPVAVS